MRAVLKELALWRREADVGVGARTIPVISWDAWTTLTSSQRMTTRRASGGSHTEVRDTIKQIHTRNAQIHVRNGQIHVRNGQIAPRRRAVASAG